MLELDLEVTRAVEGAERRRKGLRLVLTSVGARRSLRAACVVLRRRSA